MHQSTRPRIAAVYAFAAAAALGASAVVFCYLFGISMRFWGWDELGQRSSRAETWDFIFFFRLSHWFSTLLLAVTLLLAGSAGLSQSAVNGSTRVAAALGTMMGVVLGVVNTAAIAISFF